MQILTQESLVTAVKKCQENEHYRVIVVTEYVSDIDPIIDYLLQIDGVVVTHCIENSRAKFENGNFIHMISMNCNSTRGHKADLVLCAEKFFEDENVRCILQTIESHNMDFKLKKE